MGKTERLQQQMRELAVQLRVQGYESTNNGIVTGDTLCHPLFLKMLSNDTVMCQFTYAMLPYENNIASKRDNIKTGKDIIEFYHGLKTTKKNVSSVVASETHIPELRLLYKNNPSFNRIIVTHHCILDYNLLYFVGDETIQEEVGKMNQFSRLIEKDIYSGEDVIWNKEVATPKKWWQH